MAPRNMALEMFTQTIVRLGEHLSIDLRDLSVLSRKLTVLNLKYVDRKTTWEKLFPDHFVDWELVGASGPLKNSVGDMQLWLSFLDQCTWDGSEATKEQPVVVRDMCEALSSVGLEATSWNQICRLVILHMLADVLSMHAFQTVLCEKGQLDTQQRCVSLMSYLADRPHTPKEHEDALVFVLHASRMQIDTTGMESTLVQMRCKREERNMFQQIKELAAARSRPRLRDRQHKTTDDQLALDVSLSTWESFQAWSLLHQFPNVLSENIKHKLYFLSSQTNFDWTPFVSAFLGKECELGNRIKQYPVSVPDIGILSNVIQQLRMTGNAPFGQMLDFKTTCFRHFPDKLVRRMNLTQVLRLYVCSYQNSKIWKDLWKQHVPLLSPQIIRDCQEFVLRTPFAADEVVQILTA